MQKFKSEVSLITVHEHHLMWGGADQGPPELCSLPGVMKPKLWWPGLLSLSFPFPNFIAQWTEQCLLSQTQRGWRCEKSIQQFPLIIGCPVDTSPAVWLIITVAFPPPLLKAPQLATLYLGSEKSCPLPEWDGLWAPAFESKLCYPPHPFAFGAGKEEPLCAYYRNGGISNWVCEKISLSCAFFIMFFNQCNTILVPF